MCAIEDIDQFIGKIQSCRELKIPRYANFYTHHVFVGKVYEDEYKNKTGCDLYHYSSVSSSFGPPGQMTKVHFDFHKYRVDCNSPIRKIFDLKKNNGDKIYIVKRSDYPKDEKAEYACIQRAEKRLGENRYSACCNNCESTVNWIFSGDNTSEQVENDIIRKLFSSMVDGASSRGVQHQMSLIPDTILKFCVKVAVFFLEKIGNIIDLTDLIPTLFLFIDNLKCTTAFNFPNELERMLSRDFLKMKIDPKIPEELGKVINPLKIFDEIERNRTTRFLYQKFQSKAQEQHLKSMFRQAKTESVQQLQSSSKSATAYAFKFQIIFEIASLLCKIYEIRTDPCMTDDQKNRSCKRELYSSVCGVAGTVIGEMYIPIVGGYIGGLIGNTIGGAIGGTF